MQQLRQTKTSSEQSIQLRQVFDCCQDVIDSVACERAAALTTGEIVAGVPEADGILCRTVPTCATRKTTTAEALARALLQQ
jgi:hypothetical protein